MDSPGLPGLLLPPACQLAVPGLGQVFWDFGRVRDFRGLGNWWDSLWGKETPELKAEAPKIPGTCR